jgi:hypothetical protein
VAYTGLPTGPSQARHKRSNAPEISICFSWSIMVDPEGYPARKVFTSPTRLKNLSGDAKVAGTARYCLVVRAKGWNSCWYCFHQIVAHLLKSHVYIGPPHPVTLNIRFSSGPWKVSVSPLLFATATVHLIVNRNACTRLQRAVKLVKAVSRRCKGCIKDQSRLN